MTEDYLKELIARALQEDIGPGDVTTEATIPEEAASNAFMLAKQDLVLAGLEVSRAVFNQLDPTVRFTAFFQDAQRISSGTVIAELSGKTRVLLSGERLALNLLQHMSGIATITYRYAEKIAGTGARMLDTRKTLPGLRELEKYAVRMGGGKNHRMGLYDMILIKDNHIKAAGSIMKAVERVKQRAPHLKIEVETSTLDEVREALAVKADIIMLDNMSIELMRDAAAMINHRALVEASGNVTLQTVRAIAETGVDYISAGGLTHSAPAADISMKLK